MRYLLAFALLLAACTPISSITTERGKLRVERTMPVPQIAPNVNPGETLPDWNYSVTPTPQVAP